MTKFIIENNSGLPNHVAIECVKRVVKSGFESGENQYCWVTKFETLHCDVNVIARKSRGTTHSFIVQDSEG